MHETACPSRDYIRNRHLWGEFVVDAAGVNLLTERHLAHAHDLSNWELEQVTPRRFIVSSKRLEDWLGGEAATPATVAEARHDFGDMILTWHVIAARPGPYTTPEM